MNNRMLISRSESISLSASLAIICDAIKIRGSHHTGNNKCKCVEIIEREEMVPFFPQLSCELLGSVEEKL